YWNRPGEGAGASLIVRSVFTAAEIAGLRAGTDQRTESSHIGTGWRGVARRFSRSSGALGDGIDVRKLYHLNALNANGSAPSIIRINGKDAATLLSDLNLKFSGFQDPDSQWNSQFKFYATNESAPLIAASLAFQGTKVTLTYDNGEEKSEDSFAIIRQGANFTGVSDGENYYNKFCNPDAAPKPPANGTTPNQPPKTSAPPAPPQPTIKGYPWPAVRDSGANATSGYFCWFTRGKHISHERFDTVGKFLAESKKAGKKKLVIDVAANGGGFVVAGYELFAQLFLLRFWARKRGWQQAGTASQ
ncbi:peptidase s41 family protein, partial [Colletotrichum plurivorum]